jgi:hypothetical protein
MPITPPKLSDPVLIALDEAFAALQRFRDVYTQQKKATEYELERARDISRVVLRRSTFTAEQVAPRFGVESSTIRDGVSKHSCLRKAAYKPGKRLLFPLQAIEEHERNLIERGECGVCFKTVKPKK